LLDCFPGHLVKLLEEKCPPEKVHTLVIWTKNCSNLLNLDYVSEYLKRYRQLYIHYTITGMGGTVFEPTIPSEKILFKDLEKVIGFVGSPERIAIRFDPILHVRFPDGTDFSNVHKFEKIAKVASEAGITVMKFSWMQEYNKVLGRLRARKIYPVSMSRERRVKELEELKKIASEYNLRLEGCCTEETEVSRCIDGYLFNRLHPDGLVCSTKKARGQRKLCGCTESWDIGWYFPCPNGCLYCYANPKVNAQEDK